MVAAGIAAAGLAPGPGVKSRPGFNDGDIILWVAIWLRGLVTAGRGLVPATAGEYHKWVGAGQVGAPSPETIRAHFKWADLVVVAARMEKSTRVLS